MKKILLLSALLNFALPTYADKTPADKGVYKVRWVLAHQPVRAFERAAHSFAEEVARKTGNRVQVEILKSPQWPADAFQSVQSGSVEMTQTFTTFLGSKSSSFWALDLPFLFKSHQVAARVLDGPVGHQILASLEAQNVSGLAFTYSGGYMILPTANKEIHTLADFKGLKIRVNQNSPVGASLMQTVGAVPVPSQGDQYAGFDGLETTYARFTELDENLQGSYKIINDLQHSMFLTAILINKSFLASLPAEYQSIIQAAAKRVALMEREDSIADAKRIREGLSKKGYKIVSMSPEEMKKFRDAALPVYRKFEPILGKDLVQSVHGD